MKIELKKDVEKVLIASIRRYVSENMEDEIGDLQAALFLQYCLEEIGPAIYNAAIADAQRYMQDKVSELDSVCYVPESAYWSKLAKKGKLNSP